MNLLLGLKRPEIAGAGSYVMTSMGMKASRWANLLNYLETPLKITARRINMSVTTTRSVTDTYTEARARYVMGKVYDHLVSLYMRGIIAKDYADEIRRDILYLMDKKALTYFQLQFKKPGGVEIGGLHYEVRADSTISMDQDSTGLDFCGLPKNTSFP